jgi:hypothetical protein
VSERKRTRDQILADIVDLLSGGLEKMPAEERERRLGAFRELVDREEKRSSARPKAASASRTLRKPRRIPA